MLSLKQKRNPEFDSLVIRDARVVVESLKKGDKFFISQSPLLGKRHFRLVDVSI